MVYLQNNHVVLDRRFLELFYVLELDLELGLLKEVIACMDELGG